MSTPSSLQHGYNDGYNDDDFGNPFREDETPPWLLRRGESKNDDGDEIEVSTPTTTSLLSLNRDCLTFNLG